MFRELSKFTLLKHLNVDNLGKYFDMIRNSLNEMIIKLHKFNAIDDLMLKHVIGMKCISGKYSKIPGAIAKIFLCNEPAYAYPLFKTHKLDSNNLSN